MRAADSSLPASRYLIFTLLALAGSAADLLSKAWIFDWRGLPGQRAEWWLWEPYIGIQTTVNTGGLFGYGAGNGALLAAVSVLAALGIVYWLFFRGVARDRVLTIVLGLIMGGILGNLYDRLGLWFEPGLPLEWRHGVRDWILFRYGEYTWPNFNIADALLVCGAIALVWHAQRVPSPDSAATDE